MVLLRPVVICLSCSHLSTCCGRAIRRLPKRLQYLGVAGWSFGETRWTLQALNEALDADAKIVPGHGPFTDLQTIAWNLDYHNAVEKEMTAAISQGLSLEDTAARLKLTDFEGYDLFGWVHLGLDVPALYKDLQ